MSNQIIKPLHGLRGIAAVTVILGHWPLFPSTPSLGVVLFFALSGFLIGKLYMEQQFDVGTAWRYAVARVARVYPLFAAVVVAAALLNRYAGSAVFRLAPDDMVRQLLFSGSAKTIWTISVEFQFYALFLLIWSVRSRLRGSALPLLIAMLGTSAAAAVMIRHNVTNMNVFSYLPIFLAGLLIARLTARDDGRFRVAAGYAAPALAACYVVLFVGLPHVRFVHNVYLNPVAIGVCAALLAATLIAHDCRFNRILSLPVFVWLGEISFGIYLLHRFAQAIVDPLLAGATPLLTLPVKIALTLILAQLANRLIERPCRSLIRDIGERIAPRDARPHLEPGSSHPAA